EILGLFDDLDNSLDGWLIKSENYQALNTILPKFKERVQTIYIDPPFNLDSSDQFLYRTNYKDANWATLLENRLKLAKDILDKKGSIFVRCDYNGNWIVRCLMDSEFGKENFRNEIVVRRFRKNVMEKEIKKLPEGIDTIFIYSLTDKFKYLHPYKAKAQRREGFWRHMGDSSGQGTSKIFFGKELSPPKGKHWKYSQEKINQMIEEGTLILVCSNCGYQHDKTKEDWRGCPNCKEDKFIPKYWVDAGEEEVLDSNWTDLYGYSTGWQFQTENSEILLNRVMKSTSNEGDLVMDFFLGSGTTTAVAHKLGRKWIGVEMGEHFYSVVLPRMKKVLAYDKSGISKEIKEYQGGGFFKYFELEQYEDTLRRVIYKESHPFMNFSDKTTIYQQYVFLNDLKMLDAIELDHKNNKIKIDFSKIYPDIDLAETISLVSGKKIKKIEKDGVIIEKDENTTGKINFDNIPFSLIRPLIWWTK
ncbi:MAG: site-specific DNA-methyltransferase, partial [Candidatus Altiarchaeales archaeon HGW-Altiarchaeales-1]